MAASFRHPGAVLDKDKDEYKEEDKEEEEEEDGAEAGGGVKEVKELWDVVYVIPTEKEKVECCNNGCTDQAVATWSSNIDPEDKLDLCKKC